MTDENATTNLTVIDFVYIEIALKIALEQYIAMDCDNSVAYAKIKSVHEKISALNEAQNNESRWKMYEPSIIL